MTTSTTPTTQKPCALPELPAELRNRIHRYTLCQEGILRITKGNFQHPSLLRTCQQIRNEASGIFYQESEISFRLHDFNPDVALSFNKHRPSHWGPARVDFGKNPTSWTNFLSLMRAVFEDEVVAMGTIDDDKTIQGTRKTAWNVAAAAAHMISKLEDAGGSWNDAVEVLGHYKVATEPLIHWT
ncbi:hypothetical protein CLAFUW4_08768 [Fulvia fulva]|uniref:Uncharacterized protein n=1 Tax=Passalora fulva TaxID=5499 RepID=A0A9Q8PG21_PASFU|nr:uncharacterized protein CLAFUR5_08868 [Fulvia fulva]KAK4614234.1 hypothetical protein CLAFUR4_08773 [Fulvia fulva]KAK4614511.1 hypothetical protein CLAFUR0_08768 [Fulvia fulva]UJO21825.1 hypothetical protein CLAFUR5_08868 [Fulvia fulva]WPV20438.1 hypothetical protein CLAFUW4_08768 [Fulvia fulva]WPV34978.1 hypothetical protein CLAFUW7_08768 [Fulvia fulva]